IFARALTHRTDEFIGDALTAFSRELGAERRVADGVLPAVRTTVEEVRFRDLRIEVLDSTGAVIAASPLADPDSAPLLAAESRVDSALRVRDGRGSRALTVRSGKDLYRVVTRPVSIAGAR